jgi:arsenate reductase-like glutaredoxin family protein
MRDAVNALLQASTRAADAIDELDEGLSLRELREAIADAQDSASTLTRAAANVERLLDLADLAQYQATRAAATAGAQTATHQ